MTVTAVGVEELLSRMTSSNSHVICSESSLAKVTKQHTELVAATIRTIFAQPKPDAVRAHVEVVADMLHGQFPPSPSCCVRPRKTTSPRSPTSRTRTGARFGPPTRSSDSTKRSSAPHRRRRHLPQPRRAPAPIEAHDEWQDSDRRYLSEASMVLLNPLPPTALEPRRDNPSEVMDQPQPALQTA